MSKRRVLGKTNLAAAIDTPTPPPVESQPKDEFICPMCNLPITSLSKLNHHVDSVHLNTEQPKTQHKRHVSKLSISSITTTSSIGPVKLPKDHFIRPSNGMKCSDSRCHIKIGLKHSAFNCAKCGRVYCSTHCSIPLKLNAKLEIVDQESDGVISRCCTSCLNEYDGWNDVIGNVDIIDKTKEFLKLRKAQNEEHSLENLILERRFEKIFNWIIGSYRTKTKITDTSIKQFETELCSWKPNSEYHKCKICSTTFGFFIRKHHCRICGDVVCGDLSKGCSMIVPLGIIFDLMKLDKLNDENKHQFEEIESFLKQDYFGIRICLHCKKKVLNKRVFRLDQLKIHENNDFVNIFKIWKLIYHKIQSENISEIQNDDENLMIVGLFQRLDKLIKQIDEIVTTNRSIPRDEIRMFNTLKGAIANYVQIKLPILRKAQEDKLQREREVLQNLINDKPKISKKDLRLKREKLMVLNEQKFVVGNLYEDFKKQRRFDDLKTLDSNLADIEKEIQELTEELGDEAFH